MTIRLLFFIFVCGVSMHQIIFERDVSGDAGVGMSTEKYIVDILGFCIDSDLSVVEGRWFFCLLLIAFGLFIFISNFSCLLDRFLNLSLFIRDSSKSCSLFNFIFCLQCSCLSLFFLFFLFNSHIVINFFCCLSLLFLNLSFSQTFFSLSFDIFLIGIHSHFFCSFWFAPSQKMETFLQIFLLLKKSQFSLFPASFSNLESWNNENRSKEQKWQMKLMPEKAVSQNPVSHVAFWSRLVKNN